MCAAHSHRMHSDVAVNAEDPLVRVQGVVMIKHQGIDAVVLEIPKDHGGVEGGRSVVKADHVRIGRLTARHVLIFVSMNSAECVTTGYERYHIAVVESGSVKRRPVTFQRLFGLRNARRPSHDRVNAAGSERDFLPTTPSCGGHHTKREQIGGASPRVDKASHVGKRAIKGPSKVLVTV
ncbi:hypothetical protein COL5a_011147 [Colletotrichum fioriniae]|nr:hypothetical protein COL5a_011147 [Colletotrichum fioriniae]